MLAWAAVHFRTEVDTAEMQTSQSISKSMRAEIRGNHTESYSPIPAAFLVAGTGLSPLVLAQGHQTKDVMEAVVGTQVWQ